MFDLFVIDLASVLQDYHAELCCYFLQRTVLLYYCIIVYTTAILPPFRILQHCDTTGSGKSVL